MFLQFSPPKPVARKPSVPKLEEKEEVPILKFEPFTPSAKVFFEQISLNSTAVKRVEIRNDSHNVLNVNVTREPPVERNVSLGWIHAVILAKSSAILDITWVPIENGSWRDYITLQDARNIRKDISINFSTAKLAQQKKPNSSMQKNTARKSPPNSYKTKSKKNKSPLKTWKKKSEDFSNMFLVKSPTKNSMVMKMPLGELQQSSNTTKTLKDFYCEDNFVYGKENSPLVKSPQPVQSPDLFTSSFWSGTEKFDLGYDRRGTYTVGEEDYVSPREEFRDSLEPNDSLPTDARIRQLCFTPIVLKTPAVPTSVRTTITSITFSPQLCSTEEKSMDSWSSVRPSLTGKCLFADRLQVPAVEALRQRDTIEVICSPKTCHNKEMSLSALEMSSFSAVPRHHSSPEFLSASAWSQSAHQAFSGNAARDVIEADMWTKPPARSLKPIQEERSSVFLKRKTTFEVPVSFISPPKKAHIVRKKLNWSKHSPRRSFHILHRLSRKTVADNVADTTTTISSTLDPFIASSLFFDENWMRDQECLFKKWLNALLTPPMDLDSSTQVRKIDVAKLWASCKNKKLEMAPTKEKVSSMYLTHNRLDKLRVAAAAFLDSEQMRVVLSKVAQMVEERKLSIREDKDLHLDIGLQSKVMSILLSYNPLWLRLGLETVYREKIPLDSNSDLVGLSTFIMLRFFRNGAAKQQNVFVKKYADNVKKFTLKKFLLLVYFLDKAKANKLIAHDPCLFCKNSEIKESREVLLAFSRDLLSCVGDLTKYLRIVGYVVSHKQSYLDEFNYAVVLLGNDLRDGVRLARIMELILLRNDLLPKLRVPAISRLQKIHNVEVALHALQSSFVLLGDISARDIVDGHREKTLSLLWQIIYKFQAPRFLHAADRVKTWWRSLPVVIERRIRGREKRHQNRAAAKIQAFWRGRRIRAEYLALKDHTITIQRKWRATLAARRQRQHFVELRSKALLVQKKWRSVLVARRTRNVFLRQKRAVAVIEAFYIAIRLRKVQEERLRACLVIQRRWRELRSARECRRTYLLKKSSALKLQQWWRATSKMLAARRRHLKLAKACVSTQRRWRCLQIAKEARKSFVEKRAAAKTISRWWKGRKHMLGAREDFLQQRQATQILQKAWRMKRCRTRFLKLKSAATSLQARWRATLRMRPERALFLRKRSAALVLQARWKAHLEMRRQVLQYKTLKKAVRIVEDRRTATLAMRAQRCSYLKTRSSALVIQERWRSFIRTRVTRRGFLEKLQAVKVLQARWRATLKMRSDRKRYGDIKRCCNLVQTRWRSLLLARTARRDFLRQKKAAAVLQSRFRARLLMLKARNDYISLRASVVALQKHRRSLLAMRQSRADFLRQKTAAIVLQKRWKALKTAREARERFQRTKNAVVVLQRGWRAAIAMRRARNDFLETKLAVLIIQKRWLATKCMQYERRLFLEKKAAAVALQSCWRGRAVRKRHQELVLAAVVVQRRWRALTEMRQERMLYLRMKQAVVVLEEHWIAKREMNREKAVFVRKRNAAVVLQTNWRAFAARKKYLRTLDAAKCIQQRWRALTEMRQERMLYLRMKQAVVVLEEHWIAKREMNREIAVFVRKRNAAVVLQANWRAFAARKKYLRTLDAAKCIQQRWRARTLMAEQRCKFLQLKRSAVALQRAWRNKRLAVDQRETYLEMKIAARILQARFRALRQMRFERNNYKNLLKAVRLIQERRRSTLAARKCRLEFLAQKSATVKIQVWWRSVLEMRETRQQYLVDVRSVSLIQARWRATLAMRRDRKDFLVKKAVAMKISKWWKGRLQMLDERRYYLRLLKSVPFVQLLWKNRQVAKKARKDFLRLRHAAVVTQTRWKAREAMLKARKDYLETRQAAIKVQTLWRLNRAARIERARFLALKKAVHRVEERRKALLLMRREKEAYSSLRNAAVLLQTLWRRRLAVKKDVNNFKKQKLAILAVQKWWRKVLRIRKEKQERKEAEAATKIQALWRGHSVRKRCVEAVAEARERLNSANENVKPENTMKHVFLKNLMQSTGNLGLFQLLQCLEIIEKVTRLCPVSSVENCDACCKYLNDIMENSNRSVHHCYILEECGKILVNLIRERTTRPLVFKHCNLENLLKLMLSWCDKTGDLFLILSTLFYLLLQDENIRMSVSASRSQCLILGRIKEQCARRLKMDRNMKNTTRNMPVYCPPSHKHDCGYSSRNLYFSNRNDVIHSLSELIKF